jgi:hypothetical protein
MRATLAPSTFCPKNELLSLPCCRKESAAGAVVAGIGDPGRLSAVQIPIDPGEDFLSIFEVMRLLLEILVVGALIYFGWDVPFKQWSNEASTAMQALLPARQQTTSDQTTIIGPKAAREGTRGGAVRPTSTPHR